MKKSYDNFNKCFVLLFIFLIYFSFLFIFLFNKKLIIFKVFNGVVFDSNNVLLVLNDKELKIFNKNKKLYINNKSYVFNISKIDNDVLERNGDKYNNVFIEINLSNMYKVGDVLSLTIMNDRKCLFKIFNVIWDGD